MRKIAIRKILEEAYELRAIFSHYKRIKTAYHQYALDMQNKSVALSSHNYQYYVADAREFVLVKPRFKNNEYVHEFLSKDLDVSCDELLTKTKLIEAKISRDMRYAKFDGAAGNIIQALEEIRLLWKE
jgi:hypothetical protein